jgi:hypothetical protein
MNPLLAQKRPARDLCRCLELNKKISSQLTPTQVFSLGGVSDCLFYFAAFFNSSQQRLGFQKRGLCFFKLLAALFDLLSKADF